MKTNSNSARIKTYWNRRRLANIFLYRTGAERLLWTVTVERRDGRGAGAEGEAGGGDTGAARAPAGRPAAPQGRLLDEAARVETATDRRQTAQARRTPAAC